ncbi:hypothetical protein BDK51DRAFT_29147, partial [Blyttiomyces helicus]
ADPIDFTTALEAIIRDPNQHVPRILHTSSQLYSFQSAHLSLPVDVRGGTALPTHFDVIDTAKLVDTIGHLNVLFATAPLLKPAPRSVINTASRYPLKYGWTPREHLKDGLYMDLSLLSVLLGLPPLWVPTAIQHGGSPGAWPVTKAERHARKLFRTEMKSIANIYGIMQSIIVGQNQKLIDYEMFLKEARKGCETEFPMWLYLLGVCTSEKLMAQGWTLKELVGTANATAVRKRTPPATTTTLARVEIWSAECEHLRVVEHPEDRATHVAVVFMVPVVALYVSGPKQLLVTTAEIVVSMGPGAAQDLLSADCAIAIGQQFPTILELELTPDLDNSPDLQVPIYIPIPFPFPINVLKARIKIARKSSWIKVTVPALHPRRHGLNMPDAFKDLKAESTFPFPAPTRTTLLGLPRVALDALPLVNPSTRAWLSWNEDHFRHSLSPNERSCPTFELKNSISNMLKATLGKTELSGTRDVTWFGVMDVDSFGSQRGAAFAVTDVRFDADSASVVLDVGIAIMPPKSPKPMVKLWEALQRGKPATMNGKLTPVPAKLETYLASGPHAEAAQFFHRVAVSVPFVADVWYSEKGKRAWKEIELLAVSAWYSRLAVHQLSDDFRELVRLAGKQAMEEVLGDAPTDAEVRVIERHASEIGAGTSSSAVDLVGVVVRALEARKQELRRSGGSMENEWGLRDVVGALTRVAIGKPRKWSNLVDIMFEPGPRQTGNSVCSPTLPSPGIKASCNLTS